MDPAGGKNISKILTICSLAIGFFFASYFLYPVFASPPGSPFAPGETLNPNCQPGDPNCTVYPPLTTSLTTSTVVAIGTSTLNFGNGLILLNGAAQTLTLSSTTLANATSTNLNVSGLFSVVGTSTLATTTISSLTVTSCVGCGTGTGGVNTSTINYFAVYQTATTTTGTPNAIVSSNGVTFTNATSTNFYVSNAAVLPNTTSTGNLSVSGTASIGMTLGQDNTSPSLLLPANYNSLQFGSGRTASSWEMSIGEYVGALTPWIATRATDLWVSIPSGFAFSPLSNGLINLGQAARRWAGSWIAGTYDTTQVSGSNAVKMLDGARVNFSTADTNAYLYRSATDTIATPGAFSVAGTTTLATTTLASTFLSGMTAGSIFFASTSGQIAQNNGGLFWDNTNKRLGLGTAAPGNGLTVVQYFTLDTLPALGANGGKFGFFDTDSPGGAPKYGLLGGVLNTGDSYLQVQRIDGTATAYNMLLQPNGGKVGIGTTTPNAQLAVKAAAGNAMLNITSSTDASALYMDVSGNVGIGTMSPNALLQIQNSTAGLTTVGGARGLTLDGVGAVGSLVEMGIGSLAGVPSANSPGLIGFKTTNNVSFTLGDLYFATRSTTTNAPATVRMTIQSGGNVGIGTTTPNAQLAVKAAAGNAMLNITSSTDASALYVDTMGSVGLGTTAPGASLDIAASASGKGIQIGNNSNYEIYFTGSGGANIYQSTLNQSLNISSNGGSFSLGSSQDAQHLNIVSGLVGVNTISPNAQLAVKAAAGNAMLNITSSTNASALYIDTMGNAGFGTASPITQLHVPGKLPVAQSGSVGTGANPYSIYVQGRYAYVINNTANTFQIFDVSNPAAPVVVGSASTASTPVSIYVQGRYAYIANTGASSFQIFDVSNPAAPVVVGSAPTGSSTNAIYVQGRYAYVGVFGFSFQIFDVSNPSAPVMVGSATTGFQPNALYVQGRYAYVANYGANTLQVIDVSSSTAPAVVGSVATGINPYAIYAQGRYAYVANFGSSTLQIFDVSSSTAPVSVGLVGTNVGPRSVYVQGRYAYVANYTSSTLQVIDVSSSTAPVSVGTVGTGTGAQSVYIQGRYAYVVNNGASTLQAFDIGGSYIQQLEAGGIESGTLNVRDNLQAVDAAFSGGVNIAQSLNLSGNFGLNGAFNLSGMATGSILFASSSGQIAQNNGGLFWDNTNRRLGLGNSAPGAVLDIQGAGVSVPSAKITPNATGGDGLQIVTTGGYEIDFTGSTGANILQSAANQPLGISANGGAIYIGSSQDAQHLNVVGGKVGVGSSTPNAQLAVKAVAGNAMLNITSSTDSSVLYINTLGYVGIGQPTPGYKLDIGSGDVNLSSSQYYRVNGLAIMGSDGTSVVYVGTSANADLSLYAGGGGNPRMKILNSSGNVGIGTTTPTAQLSIQGATIATSSNSLLVSNVSSTQLMKVRDSGDISLGNDGLYYEASTTVSYLNALETGPLNFTDDAGMVSWVDMNVTTASPAGTPDSYTASIGGNPMLMVYAESNGSGGIQNQTISINTSTTSTYKLYIDAGGSANAGLGVNGFIKSTGYIAGTTTLDLAETYPLNPTCGQNNSCPDVGDVVCEANFGDATSSDFVIEKCSASSTEKSIGVISANPGFVLGGYNPNETLNNNNGLFPSTFKPVALAGRVPVNVSNLNGPIAAGDLLTSSNIPGVAIKAIEPGRVIGVALQSFTTSSGFATGSVKMFVNPHWSPGSLAEEQIANTLPDFSIKTILDKFTLAVKNSLRKLGLLVQDGVARVNKLFTNELCVGNTCVNEQQLQELLQKNQVTFSAPMPTSAPTPTAPLLPAQPSPALPSAPSPTPTSTSPASSTASSAPAPVPSVTSTTPVLPQPIPPAPAPAPLVVSTTPTNVPPPVLPPTAPTSTAVAPHPTTTTTP